MAIYADVLFAMNFMAFFLLIYVYSFFIKASPGLWKIFIVSAMCGIYSITEIVYSLPYFLRTAVLFCFAGVIYGKTGIVKNTFGMIFCSIAIETAVIIALSLLGKKIVILNGVSFVSEFNGVGVSIWLLSYPAFIFGNRFFFLLKKRKKICLQYNGKRTVFYAMYDSGNLLCYNGKAVIITIWGVVSDLFESENYNQFCASGMNKTVFKSVSGEGEMPVFKPEKCFVNSVEKDIYIGVIEDNLFGSYTAIVGDV